MNEKNIYLGGGCFWGVEHYFLQKYSHLDLKTEVGYMGGSADSPSYREVCSGTTGHAEVVKLTFSSEKLSLEEILKQFFLIHDPTTLNRQGPDIGTQYRSCIFYDNSEDESIIKNYIKKLVKTNAFVRPIVTQVDSAAIFWPAEEYHQKYFLKNPDKQSCHLY